VAQVRLARVGIGAQSRPVPFFLNLLVGNGTFHDEDEGLELSLFGQVKVLEKIVAIFVRENGIVQVHSRQARDRA
jgi:hypothetical protein